MSIAESLLPEFDHEMANTRKMLEAVPNDKLAFKPHEKCNEMAGLVTHLVTIPMGRGNNQHRIAGFYRLHPASAVKSREEAIEIFEKNTAAARGAIAGAKDEALFQNWSLSGNGQVFFTMPRIAVMRGFVINHAIHHRAQLGMYLRHCGAKVPGMYGPSADETM